MTLFLLKQSILLRTLEDYSNQFSMNYVSRKHKEIKVNKPELKDLIDKISPIINKANQISLLYNPRNLQR
jgi:hypothetical protein